MRPLGRAAFIPLIVVALGFAVPVWAHKPTVTTFTYNKDIRPIFDAKCGSCHRSGGVAPMSLLTYREAFPWAVSIKNEVLNLTMPPWFVDERVGAFKHRGALSAKEMDTIVDWCLGGSPEGDPVTSSPSPVSDDADSWPLGSPDLELVMPSAFELDADSSEAVEELVLASGLGAGRTLCAIDFKPGSANIVRSATMTLGDGSELLATWVPGQAPQVFPSGIGWRVPAGAEIRLRLHYKKTWLDEGSAVSDQSTLALYFHESDAVKLVTTISVNLGSPHTMGEDAELVALVPELETPVEAFSADLVLPDGSREALIRLYQPSPDWPRKYWLAEPVRLPSGSRVELSVTASEPATPAMLLDIVSR